MNTQFLNNNRKAFTEEEKFINQPVIYDFYQSGKVIYHGKSPLEISYNHILKRAIDIIISTLLIIIVFPWLLPIMAFIIKLDSEGPIFFLQKRNKKGSKQFTCIKFRTMFLNKEADTLAACENDKRITYVGGFLRRNHLDELPQLFNVLWGDMSLIGPRPHMVVENMNFEKVVKDYSYRHKVKPGITGLAQSLGHYGYLTDYNRLKERVELDFVYVKQWSFKMEFQIIFRTFYMIFRSEKAS
jgi:putative colanic acid biosynthesis UDP-glucose lipid carrier transferase